MREVSDNFEAALNDTLTFDSDDDAAEEANLTRQLEELPVSRPQPELPPPSPVTASPAPASALPPVIARAVPAAATASPPAEMPLSLADNPPPASSPQRDAFSELAAAADEGTARWEQLRPPPARFEPMRRGPVVVTWVFGALAVAATDGM